MHDYGRTGRYDTDDIDSVVVPRRGQTGLVIIVAAVVAAGTMLGLQVGVTRWGKGNASVPVLVGLSEVEARGAAEGQHLVFVVAGRMPDAVVARGGVAEQTPLAGTSVARGTVVRVKISSGLPGASSDRPHVQPLGPAPDPRRVPPAPVAPPAPPAKVAPPAPPAKVAPSAPPVPRGPTVAVPKVVGMRLQLATSRLQAAGLTVGSLSYEADEDHMESFVLRQTPPAGGNAPRGSAVDLVVNKLE
jgi:beta-lactam-binding protein with PASTA domain